MHNDPSSNKATHHVAMGQLQEIPDSWDIKEGTYDGNQIIIRKNGGLSVIKDRSYYSTRTGISFKFKTNKGDGFPKQSETQQLYQIEDDIFDVFQTDTKAIVSVILTTNGFREFVIYSSSLEWSIRCFSQLKANKSGYELTTYSEEDKGWVVYESY